MQRKWSISPGRQEDKKNGTWDVGSWLGTYWNSVQSRGALLSISYRYFFCLLSISMLRTVAWEKQDDSQVSIWEAIVESPITLVRNSRLWSAQHKLTTVSAFFIRCRLLEDFDYLSIPQSFVNQTLLVADMETQIFLSSLLMYIRKRGEAGKKGAKDRTDWSEKL